MLAMSIYLINFGLLICKCGSRGSVYGMIDVGSYNHEQDYNNNQVVTKSSAIKIKEACNAM